MMRLLFVTLHFHIVFFADSLSFLINHTNPLSLRTVFITIKDSTCLY
jgi:hypothetical protein